MVPGEILMVPGEILMVPGEIKSLGKWTRFEFVAPTAKEMMDRLMTVGCGPFKIYKANSCNWDGVNYRDTPAEDYSLEICMSSFGTWDVEIIVPLRVRHR